MELLFSIFRLLAGVGLFMFAMYLIEESLKHLSGRNFKLFLKKITKNNLGAAAGGAVVTAILQSSSMVSLMVLAFVGAGIFTMKNAMAIILGANLGTTLDSWLVATLGFKINIEIIAYPVVFVGGLMLLTFSKRSTFKYLSYFLLGFGLLFIGLGFMKSAMEVQVQNIDFSKFADMPSIVFLLIGFGITLLVQSSSVTMALTLSALHFGAISFPGAAAIVLGSETGTTIKIMLSAIGGNAAKKRVVLGNFIFNIVLTVFAFLFLSSILKFIQDGMQIRDPLLSLVTFSTCINLAGVLIFLPFLGPFTKLLTKFFKQTDEALASFIGQAKTSEPESALELFQKETEYFIYYSIVFNKALFQMDSATKIQDLAFQELIERRGFLKKTIQEKYDFLKQLQGEIQSFYVTLRTRLSDRETSMLNQYILSVRDAMYAVKSLHDIESNIENLSKSSLDLKFSFYTQSKQQTDSLYKDLLELMQQTSPEDATAFLLLYRQVREKYEHALNSFYTHAQQAPLDGLDMTLLINFNRELYASNISLWMSVKDYILEEAHATLLNEQINYKS